MITLRDCIQYLDVNKFHLTLLELFYELQLSNVLVPTELTTFVDSIPSHEPHQQALDRMKEEEEALNQSILKYLNDQKYHLSCSTLADELNYSVRELDALHSDSRPSLKEIYHHSQSQPFISAQDNKQVELWKSHFQQLTGTLPVELHHHLFPLLFEVIQQYQKWPSIQCSFIQFTCGLFPELSSAQLKTLGDYWVKFIKRIPPGLILQTLRDISAASIFPSTLALLLRMAKEINSNELRTWEIFARLYSELSPSLRKEIHEFVSEKLPTSSFTRADYQATIFPFLLEIFLQDPSICLRSLPALKSQPQIFKNWVLFLSSLAPPRWQLQTYIQIFHSTFQESTLKEPVRQAKVFQFLKTIASTEIPNQRKIVQLLLPICSQLRLQPSQLQAYLPELISSPDILKFWNIPGTSSCSTCITIALPLVFAGLLPGTHSPQEIIQRFHSIIVSISPFHEELHLACHETFYHLSTLPMYTYPLVGLIVELLSLSDHESKYIVWKLTLGFCQVLLGTLEIETIVKRLLPSLVAATTARSLSPAIHQLVVNECIEVIGFVYSNTLEERILNRVDNQVDVLIEVTPINISLLDALVARLCLAAASWEGHDWNPVLKKLEAVAQRIARAENLSPTPALTSLIQTLSDLFHMHANQEALALLSQATTLPMDSEGISKTGFFTRKKFVSQANSPSSRRFFSATQHLSPMSRLSNRMFKPRSPNFLYRLHQKGSPRGQPHKSPPPRPASPA